MGHKEQSGRIGAPAMNSRESALRPHRCLPPLPDPGERMRRRGESLHPPRSIHHILFYSHHARRATWHRHVTHRNTTFRTPETGTRTSPKSEMPLKLPAIASWNVPVLPFVSMTCAVRDSSFGPGPNSICLIV